MLLQIRHCNKDVSDNSKNLIKRNESFKGIPCHLMHILINPSPRRFQGFTLGRSVAGGGQAFVISEPTALSPISILRVSQHTRAS